MKLSARKLAVVAVIVALTTGVSGYFMARLQVGRSTAQRFAAASAVTTTAADAPPLAPTYATLGARTHLANHAWRSSPACSPRARRGAPITARRPPCRTPSTRCIPPPASPATARPPASASAMCRR